MGKLFENKKVFMIVSIISMALGVLLVWLGVTQTFYPKDDAFIVPSIVVLFTMAGVNTIVALGNLIYLLIKKNGTFFSAVFIILCSLALIFFEVGFGEINILAAIVWAISILDGLLLVVLNVLNNKHLSADEEKIDFRGNVSLVFNILSMVSLLMIFVIPIYKYDDGYELNTLILIQMLSGKAGLDIVVLLYFLIAFIISAISIIFFMRVLSCYFSKSEKYASASRKSVYINLVMTAIFFVIGLIYVYIYSSNGWEVTTSSYIPFLITAAITVGHAAFNYIYPQDSRQKQSGLGKYRVLILVADLLFVALTIITCLMDIISVEFEYKIMGSLYSKKITINGFVILKEEPAMATFSILVFVILAIIITCSISVVLSLVSFFSKSKEFSYISKISIILCSVFVFGISLFGLYYDVAQKVNTEAINEMLAAYGYDVNVGNVINEKVSTQTIWMLPVIVGLLVLILIFKPFTRLSSEMAGYVDGEISIKEAAPIDVNIITPGFASNPEENSTEDVDDNELSEEFALENGIDQTEDLSEEDSEEEIIPGADEHDLPDFDPCPAFSELDEKEKAFKKDLRRRLQSPFPELSLANLARFVVEYARDSRLHLSYTVEDIATFIAGLGATRLSILQGMSGTGKTSLPKIFCEAIFGKVEIVEVESSWKDKNELLGYYNEFSKVYTPKKFTQALYRAKLNPEVITLIVLDEMNLSRIEYYFSDFLSLMENEEDKREIKLLNTKLYNQYDGTRHAYTALSEGHTLKIPTNVWFIGTANRDESTFEISDKVYDRANTMNFNKRAPKVRSFGEPKSQQFVTYQDFDRILKDAKDNFEFDLEEYEIVKKVEELLRPYNISFGNRILLQIENFVKVYCSCFTNSKDVIPDAVEKILLSKVVAKLEFKSIENKDELANKFDKLKLPSCAEFIRKISGDF